MATDHLSVWNNCLEFIKDNVRENVYLMWFEPIKPISLVDNVLTIGVPSYVFFEWLEKNAAKLLKTAIFKELGATGKLKYKITMVEKSVKQEEVAITLPGIQHRSTKNPPKKPLDPFKEPERIPNPDVLPGIVNMDIPSNLIPSLNFDNYIEGECNKLARLAGKIIAESAPGSTPYNPFFIYSNTGLGKTHLAHAIGLEVKANFPDKVVLYVNSDLFYQQFVEASHNNNYVDFICFYQRVDVLIIDDIQFLANKTKTQEAFFNIFNHLQQRKKQIIICADKAPAEISGFEARVLNRFKWSLVAELTPPDLATRIAILKKKLENNGIEFPEEVVEYIALRVTTNIRELEGAMIAVLAQSSINHKQITLDLAREMVDKYVRSNSRDNISIEYIQKIVSDHFSIPVETINTSTRRREVAQPRQICMYFAKKYTKLPLSTIGQYCGNKDHATVLHACRVISDLYESDKNMRRDIDEIDKKMKL